MFARRQQRMIDIQFESWRQTSALAFCTVTITDGSPFSKLSADALVSDTSVAVTSDTPSEHVRTPLDHATALLQVCEQTREECTSMFYHNNTFQVEANTFSNYHERNGAEVKVCSMFLDTIGRDNSSEIRNIGMLVRRLPRFDE
ncbi:hypothetical protein AC579_2732 [Pseudocercospora musae]|uniref:Uncharacterized protein n=1 Tax=Pseudocercospora musae TaxID=113226 RepID=A0A139IVH3_9PEZI|nr:hypothetical protein AC579_2732 [Pseudocercospora musae]